MFIPARSLRQIARSVFQPIKAVFRRLRQCSHQFHRITIENNSQWKDYNETITLDLYLAKPNSRERLTILHPVLGGDNFIVSFLSHYFAFLHRRNCVVVHRGQYPFSATSPEGFEQRLQAYLYNYEIAENHLQELEVIEYETTEIVSIGISMGGIVNSILATQDQYDRYISIMGGASIIEIMYNSRLEEFKDWFKAQMIKYNVSREKILTMYDQAIETDFTHRYKGVDSNKLFTVSTLFDSIVPTKNQRKLVKLGQPRCNIWIPTGHFSLFLLTPVVLLILSWWSLRAHAKKRD